MKRVVLLAAFALMTVGMPAGAAPSDCNAVVSMSQGRQVYSGTALQSSMPPDSPLEAATGEQWMVLYKGGQSLRFFTVGANWNSLVEHGRCGTDFEIDRVVFIFDPKGTAELVADLGKVLDIAHARYPNADVDLSLLVGGEGHVICQVQQVNLVNVAASKIHAQYVGQMTMPEAGPDLDVPCDQYADNKGHLTAAGAVNANRQVAEFYNPPTLPASGDRFITLLRGTSVTPGDVFWWNADYYRSLPYTANTGWVDGDRCGYTAMYAFLMWNGEVVGRVTFVRVPGAATYAVVNDKYMDEAERWYSGVPADEPGTGQDNELKDCPTVVQSYEPYTGPDERPKVTYRAGGVLLEVRDYANTVAGPAVKFRLVESTSQRVTVVAFENDLPVIVVYYDSLRADVVMNAEG